MGFIAFSGLETLLSIKMEIAGIFAEGATQPGAIDIARISAGQR